RIIATVVGRQVYHERPQAEAAKAAVAYPLLELADCRGPARDVDAGERQEAGRMALGYRGHRLVRHERLAAVARRLVEAGDEHLGNAGRIEPGENHFIVHRHALSGNPVGLEIGLALLEHTEVAELRLGEVV